MTIFLESRGEPLTGQYHVGAVIMNRVYAEEYPDTVCEVVNQPHQFATKVISPGTPDEIATASMVAVDLYYNYLPNDRILWFFEPNVVNPGWAKNLKPAFQVGNHLFLMKDTTEANNRSN